jgi:LysM repeat protein
VADTAAAPVHADATKRRPAISQREIAPRSDPKPSHSVSKDEHPKTPSSSGKTYIVKKGDNPVTIAKKLKVSYDDLIALNHIENPHKLQIGQKLLIPAKAAKTKMARSTNEATRQQPFSCSGGVFNIVMHRKSAYILFLAVLGLLVIGIVMLFSTSAFARDSHGDVYFFHQTPGDVVWRRTCGLHLRRPDRLSPVAADVVALVCAGARGLWRSVMCRILACA